MHIKNVKKEKRPRKPLKALRRRRRTFNAFELKAFMAALMVLDHLPHIPGLCSPAVEAVFHALTRCVAAWFAYAAVESFLHTRSHLNYLARLFVGAAAMSLGNLVLNHFGAEKGVILNDNIFLTLGLGVLALCAVSGFTKASPWRKMWGLAAATAIVGLGAIFADQGLLVLPFMLITYGCRRDKQRRLTLYLLMALVLFAMAYHPYPTFGATIQALGMESDFLFITVLPFLRMYNGKRGPRGTNSTLFFYLFYPAHLWVLQIIALLVAR